MNYLDGIYKLHALKKQHKEIMASGDMPKARALWEQVCSTEDALTANAQVTSPCVCFNCNGVGRLVWYHGIIRHALICRRCNGKGFITVACLHCRYASTSPNDFPRHGVCVKCEAAYPTSTSLLHDYLGKRMSATVYRILVYKFGASLVNIPDIAEGVEEFLSMRRAEY